LEEEGEEKKRESGRAYFHPTPPTKKGRRTRKREKIKRRKQNFEKTLLRPFS